jgi:hypothetical protein
VIRPSAALLAALLAACGMSPDVKEAATNALLLRQGTVSGLDRCRGTGPFTTYDVPPERMLDVVAEAAERARPCPGAPPVSVWVSERYRRVLAKERDAEADRDAGYKDPWRTAMVAFVEPMPGDPGKSRVEIHATSRGPFDRGVVAWERDLPRWIGEVLAERAAP